MENYGIQMYSVRDLAKEDLGMAISEVAKLGYKYLEFAGFFGKTPNEINGYVKDAGVEIIGTHSDWEDLRPEKIEETIAFHKAIGNKNFTIPGATLNKLYKIDDFVNVMNFAQDKLAAEGITLAYHNHSVEFEPKYWGSNILCELINRTGLYFEIDTYWAFNAGVDPIILCERLADRIKMIHLKDGLFGGFGTALGEGNAPIKTVIDMAKAHGWTMIVESEGLQPSGIEEVARCMKHLRTIDK
jgi:sugar phosphate isomerase/epimerase